MVNLFLCLDPFVVREGCVFFELVYEFRLHVCLGYFYNDVSSSCDGMEMWMKRIGMRGLLEIVTICMHIVSSSIVAILEVFSKKSY